MNNDTIWYIFCAIAYLQAGLAFGLWQLDVTRRVIAYNIGYVIIMRYPSRAARIVARIAAVIAWPLCVVCIIVAMAKWLRFQLINN